MFLNRIQHKPDVAVRSLALVVTDLPGELRDGSTCLP
jgi:hypothetical protein